MKNIPWRVENIYSTHALMSNMWIIMTDLLAYLDK